MDDLAIDEQTALTDGRIAEYLVTHADATVALEWVSIEPCAAGGFKIWASSMAGRATYDRAAPFPLWKPDVEAARLAAWGMAVDLLADWADEYRPGGFAIQAVDLAEDLIAEVPLTSPASEVTS